MNIMPFVLLVLIEADVQRLGSSSWAQREQATANLFDLMPLSMVRLRHAEFSNDPEVIVRARRIRKKWMYKHRAEIRYHLMTSICRLLPTNYRMMPYIDSGGWVDEMDHYLTIARNKTIKYPFCGLIEHDPYLNFRKATLLWLADEMADGTKESTISDWLRQMCEADRRVLETLKRSSPQREVWNDLLDSAAGKRNVRR